MEKSLTQNSSPIGRAEITFKDKLFVQLAGFGQIGRRLAGWPFQRFFTHIIFFMLGGLLVMLGGVTLPQQQLQAPHYNLNLDLPATPNPPASAGNPLPSTNHTLAINQDIVPLVAVMRLVLPPTHETAPKVIEITLYKVKSGDTIYGIAQQFGLNPETVLWANKSLEDNPDLLSVGQEVVILPANGVYHQVGGKDTIVAIAAVYKVAPESIINYPLNKIDPATLIVVPGQWLVVPEGVKPYVPRKLVSVIAEAPEDALAGTGSFMWPASGALFQDYWSGHRGLDIAAWTGAPIYAADAGYVVFAATDYTGYGKSIIIDHGNGFKTRYAHLSSVYVVVGDEITKGDQIGEMGSTGNSTGPHLHFEVILNGVSRNPHGFLP